MERTLTEILTQPHLIPAAAFNPSKSLTARELRRLSIYGGILGGARGYNTAGDVLTATVDNVDLNFLWDEFQDTLRLQNESFTALVNLLSFPVTRDVETVPQFGAEDFEEASEFGVPKGVRTQLSWFSMGYSFKWYDVAARFTWMFLAEADSRQVENVHQVILDADNRLVFNQVMKTIFNNSNLSATIRGQNYTVFKLYNGDGTVPPPYKSHTFDGTHTHYLTSGAATVDSGDLDDMLDHIREHGYMQENGTQLFFLANEQEAKVIRTFRVANGDSWDFIPSASQPTQLIPIDVQLQGPTPPTTYRGMTVIGSYGNALVIQEDYIPAGYVLLLASGGQMNAANPVGIREHTNPGLRGLQLVKGPNPNYPLVDSYYRRGFGTGIRQRAAGVVMQVTTSGTYAVPAAYV